MEDTEKEKEYVYDEISKYMHIHTALSANSHVAMWGSRMGKLGMRQLSKRVSTLGIIRSYGKFHQVWEIDRFGKINKAEGIASDYPTWKTIVRNPGCRYEIGHDEDEVCSKLITK